jgi:Ca-activated chloride channel family protein
MYLFLRLLVPAFVTLLALPAGAVPGDSADGRPAVAGILAGFPRPRDGAEAENPPTPMALPLQKTEVRLNLSGGLVEAEVTQVFTNSTDSALEAIYAFPLPSEATVTGMELRVGERVIRSVVKEREQARQEYAAARTEGRKAALLEQERPNIFTTSVTNFLAGETVRIRFTYLQAAE